MDERLEQFKTDFPAAEKSLTKERFPLSIEIARTDGLFSEGNKMPDFVERALLGLRLMAREPTAEEMIEFEIPKELTYLVETKLLEELVKKRSLEAWEWMKQNDCFGAPTIGVENYCVELVD